MIKAVLVATDEGDEGAGLLIDMTKVTRSTLAGSPCSNHFTEQTRGI